MNLFAIYTKKILTILNDLISQQVLPQDSDLSRVTVDPPREAAHGDMACNAAMVLAKPANMAPRKLAELLVPLLKTMPGVADVTIAGPGFLNLTLQTHIWQEHVQTVLEAGERYGSATIGEGHPVNVEYVSANPTGPMHVGHCRNAVLGDTIASLLQKVGFKVCREYYINDAGGQVINLARSTYLRYCEALGVTIDESAFADGLYPGDYLRPIGQHLAEKYGRRWLEQPEDSWLDTVRAEVMDAMMTRIREDLKALGITIDVFSSEKEIVGSGLLEQTLQQLEQQGDIYIGTLQPPKGHIIEDWEERPQTLFRATTYGDDVDRPLKKSDGNWTYLAGDIAYHVDKFQRGFPQMITILGADHGGYVKRLEAAVTAATKGQGTAEIKITQLVNLFENGAPLKMSKRAGTFVSLREVIDRVGKDATRFMMVTRRHDVTLDFDFAKVLEQSRDNPLFYVQYAHARACSVLRHAHALWPILETDHYSLLTNPAELAIIRQLAEWPRQVENAAMTREPHRISNYLLAVAASFHGLWNKGKDDIQLRFIDDKAPALSHARLGLVRAVASVIANGLLLLGIEPVQEMH
jgi:arginyl-tRNA synthetase